MSDQKQLAITPKTRVGELLETYPALEPVLIELAPAFRKLKNPVLRKTVGKVATLQQAASIGNLPVAEIINTLRAAIGQELSSDEDIQDGINYKRTVWFNEEKVLVRFNAIPIINSGENPMQEAIRHLEKTGDEEIFMLTTPFVPAPIIEIIGKKGFSHFCHQIKQEECHTYFHRDKG